MRRILLGLALAAAPGCATVATGGGGDQTVRITSDVPGADVTVDGLPAGATPAEVKLSRRSTHTVEVAAAGFETTRLAVAPQFNPWVIGNVVFGGVVGIVVDFATGATTTLKPNELTVKLRPFPAIPIHPAPAPVNTVPALPAQ
jgi:hypothetical protein